MSEQKENRVFSRITFDAGAVVSYDGRDWQSSLLDVSLKGALLERPDGWNAPVGSQCVVNIILSDDTMIRMEASVAHEENNHIGLRCEHVDLDSITHLRRIVELNTGNEDLLHRELSALNGS